MLLRMSKVVLRGSVVIVAQRAHEGLEPGRYVFHCHNLEHEDMAMMANLNVAPR